MRYRKRSPVNTRSGAAEYELRLRQRLLDGESLDPPEIESKTPEPTYEEFAERWFSLYVLTNNKPSEQRSKRTILKAHLLPAFGRLRLSALTTPVIEQFKAAQLEGNVRHRKTVNNHLAVLSKSLRCAIQWGLLDRMPAIQLLRVGQQPFRYLSGEEARRLLRTDSESSWNLMAHVALRTGMRRGELRALRWSDIDFARNRLTVSRAVSTSVITESKTYQSRAIPLASDIALRLKHCRRSGELVFPNDSGNVLSEWQVEDAIRRLARKAQLDHCRWHTLRHTFGTTLALNGVPLHVIKDLLGHSTLAMTLRYVHVVPSMLDDAIRTLETPSVISDPSKVGQRVGNFHRESQTSTIPSNVLLSTFGNAQQKNTSQIRCASGGLGGT